MEKTGAKNLFQQLMQHKPNYKNIHNRFKLNGHHYRFDDLV